MTPAGIGDRLRGRRALLLAVLTAGYAGYYLCRSNLSVAMPLIVDELAAEGWSRGDATVRMGGIVSLGILAYAVGKLLGGTLADLAGGRVNFLGGMAGSVAMTVLFAAAGGVPLFTLAWIGNRTVQSLGWSGIVKIASRWFPPARYGGVMGIVSLSYLFGDALARKLMAELLAAGLSWRRMFMVAAGILLVLLLVSARVVRDAPADDEQDDPAREPADQAVREGRDDAAYARDALPAEGQADLARTVGAPAAVATFERDEPADEREDDPLAESERAASQRDGEAGRGHDLRALVPSLLMPLLRDRGFQIVCGLSVLLTLVRETFNTWTPLYFHDDLGLDAAAAAETSALFPLLGGVSVLAAGFLADALGAAGRARIIVLGLAGATVAMLLLARGGVASSTAVALVAATAFLLLGPYSYLAGAIALDFGGRRAAGSAAGVIDGLGYLGGVVAGDTVARIAVAAGWAGAFAFLAAISAAGTVLAVGHLRSVRRAVG